MKKDRFNPSEQAIKFPENPRLKSEVGDLWLKNNLQKFGDLSGITVNIRTGHIITGNQRTDHIPLSNIEIYESYDKPNEQGTVAIGTAKYNGDSYFYREVDWSVEMEKEANIVGNLHSAKWDTEALRNKWNRRDLLKWGLKKTDLGKAKKPEDYKDDDILPSQLARSYSKPGHVYQLNDHRLICGSSLDPEVIGDLLKDGKANTVCTDPPYNVAYDARGTRDAIANDDMPASDFDLFLRDFFASVVSGCLPGCTWYMFHADSNGHQFRNAFVNASLYLSQCLIWDKGTSVLSRQDYHWQHEPILYGWAKDEEQAAAIIDLIKETFGVELSQFDVQHEPILYGWAEGAHEWLSDRKQKTVIQFPRPTRSPDHPTMKPVGLIRYLIDNSTHVGDIVADYFTGSGSTLIACERSGMIFRGVELKEAYCDSIVRRWVAEMMTAGKPWKVYRDGKDISRQAWLKK